MADYSLGRAHGEIDVDASSLGRASASLKFMADRMLLLGGAAIAGFGYAVKAAADFETQMSRFKAVSDTSEKDLERVRQKALQLGRDSAFGAKQVAEGFVEIAKSGATATEVLAGLGDAAVYLAAAGEIDMALATEILINAMRQFNIEAKDAGHIADLLAGAANASTSEVDDLANSLKYAGPVAAMAGISIEDTATVLAMFANAGIKGSQAGTTLRGVILGLAANTPKAEKTLRSLGIVTLDGANAFFDLEGKLKPLPEVFQILNNALSELNPKQRINALNAIFQRRALTGASLAARDGALGFLAMRGEVEKTTAQEVMKEKLDNLNGSLKILKSSLETFAIIVGENFQEPMKRTADALREVTNWLSKLDPRILEAGGYALFAFGAFLLFGGILFKVTQYTIQAYRAFRGLAEAIGLVRLMVLQLYAALGPVAIIILAIVAALIIIGVTAWYVYKNWDKIWSWIKEHPAYAAIIGILALFIAPLLLIGFILGAVAKNWREIWDKIKQWSKAAADFLERTWDGLVRWFRESFIPFFTVTLVNFFKTLPGKMAGWAMAAVDAFLGIFNNFPYKVGFVLGFLVGVFIRALTELTSLGLRLMGELVELLGEALRELIPWAINLWTDMSIKFAEGIWYIAEHMPEWLLRVMEKFLQFYDWMVQKGIDLGIQMLEKAAEWAIKFGPRIFEFIADLPAKFFQLSLDILMGFLNGLDLGIGGVVEWFTSLPRKIMEPLANLGIKFFELGIEIMKGLIEGIKSMADKAKGVMGDIANGMTGGLTDKLGITSPSKVFHQLGVQTMMGLERGMKAHQRKVLAQIDSLGNKMPDRLPPIAWAGNTRMGSDGGNVNIDTVRIQIVGVSDPAQAQAAGAAAAEGFSDALARRQVQTEARMI